MTRRCRGAMLAATMSLAAACSGDSDSEETAPLTDGGASSTSQAPVTAGPTAVPTTSASTSSSSSSTGGATTSPGSASGDGGSVGLQLVADGLTAPISMVVPPGEEERRLIVDQAGVVRELSADDELSDEPFLDVSDRIVELSQVRDDERGLLGVAFHPRWQENRRVFAFYTARPPDDAGSAVDHVNVLSEFRVAADGSGVDAGSERELLTFEQEGGSHAAGQLQFDEDGRLLVFVGDGLDAEAAQDPESMFGKVLRFIVDADASPAPAEIIASGLRHPWRIDFDEESGQTLIAEPTFEARFQEVNVLEDGANYGWDLDIPESCYTEEPAAGEATCTERPDGEQLTAPVAEYGPELGLIVSGAHIYRGDDVPPLAGQLVISEWGVSSIGRGTAGLLLVADPSDDPPWEVSELPIAEGAAADGDLLWALGEDGAGELYVLTMADIAPIAGDGAVYKVVVVVPGG